MSETAKTNESVRKSNEAAARSGHAANESVGRAARDAADLASETAQNGADKARASVHKAADSVAESANAATDLSNRAVDQGREAMLIGMRTAAGVGGQVADISFGRGHHLVSLGAQTADIYRDAGERGAEQVKALFSSAVTIGRGVQQLQHAWFEILEHTLDSAAHKPQDLLRCKNIVEVAEVQRDLYLGALSHALESTSRMLDLAGRTAQQAVQPLHGVH